MSPAFNFPSEQRVVIRPMDGLEDFQKAEQAQREAWGYNDIDVAPSSIFSVARNFGGQALGALDGERMVGFALSFGAVDGGHAHFHSHMVGVVPDYQNCGLGRMIKLAQREDALSRGIDQIVWTFDPLQLRNAHFNFVRLGGVGVRYIPNLYGMTSSPLHGGMPTDRLVIEWNLNSPQVNRALRDAPYQRHPDAVALKIPSVASDVPIAKRLAGQTRLREELIQLLHDGYVITGFERNEEVASYILENQKNEVLEKL
jgi:predicted GNAT superfamily acetyltransferase